MSLDRIRERTAARKAAGVDQTYPRHAGGAEPKPAPRKTALPCRYVGGPSGPKGWFLCENDTEPLGQTVCACRGCGPRCPGYSPAAAV